MRVWGRTLSLHFTIICRTLHTSGGDECVGVEEEELKGGPSGSKPLTAPARSLEPELR